MCVHFKIAWWEERFGIFTFPPLKFTSVAGPGELWAFIWHQSTSGPLGLHLLEASGCTPTPVHVLKDIHRAWRRRGLRNLFFCSVASTLDLNAGHLSLVWACDAGQVGRTSRRSWVWNVDRFCEFAWFLPLRFGADPPHPPSSLHTQHPYR